MGIFEKSKILATDVFETSQGLHGIDILFEICSRRLKGTVMQIEKPLIDARLRVSKVSWKFHVQTIYTFAVIYPWNLLFLKKVGYFLMVSIVFSVYKQNFTAQ